MLIDASKFEASRVNESQKECLTQKLAPNAFHPIGELSVEPDYAEIIYFGDAVDESWIAETLPDVPALVLGLKEAFEEYYGPSWCGADMKKTLEYTLKGNELERFKLDGHLPFVDLRRIEFDRERETVLIDAGCLADYNLGEHGISIKFADGKWHFGYVGEWDVEERDWNPSFLLEAFAESSSDHSHFIGRWEQRTSSEHHTQEITGDKLIVTEAGVLFGIAWGRKSKAFRYELLDCSSTHVRLKVFYTEGLPEEEIFELREGKLRNCDFDGGRPFEPWNPSA